MIRPELGKFHYEKGVLGSMTRFNPRKKLHRGIECHPGKEIHSTLEQVNSKMNEDPKEHPLQKKDKMMKVHTHKHSK